MAFIVYAGAPIRLRLKAMNRQFFLIDAFTTEKPFSGNPAAVVLLEGEDDWPKDKWMQGLAAEFNQAETAFVLPGLDSRFRLRWMTPTVEVDLCGHATMAATKAIFESGLAEADAQVTFETKSGELVCFGEEGRIGMDFPVFAFEEAAMPGKAFGGALFRGHNEMDWLVELETVAEVLAFKPDFEMINGLGMRGLSLAAASVGDLDYVLRFFAPQSGVPEDHATGSAHCCVGPYFAKKAGKESVKGYQASARGADVEVEVVGERAVLRGECRVVGSGTLVD